MACSVAPVTHLISARFATLFAAALKASDNAMLNGAECCAVRALIGR
jgi:hypothetical protein